MADEKTVLFAHDAYQFSSLEPAVGTSIGIQHAYNTVNQATVETINYKPRAEPEEAIQEAFEEIAASSIRILKSIERLNSLAEETSGELNAAKGALSLKE